MFQGRRDATFERFDEGLQIARRADARAVLGALTTARGELLQEMGDLEGAVIHHAEAAAVFLAMARLRRSALGDKTPSLALSRK